MGRTHTVKLLEPDAFNDVDLVIGSTPDEVAAEFAPWAVERDCVVVDESGYHRMLDHVPLVIPEVNPRCDSRIIRASSPAPIAARRKWSLPETVA